MQRAALRSSFAYAAFATLWILLSDAALSRWADELMRWRVETWKGLLFVTVTSGALYVVLRGTATTAADQRFRAAFEQAAVGLCHADARGRLLRVNPLAASTLGLDAQAPLPPLQELLRLDARQHAALRAALAGRLPLFSTDLRIAHGAAAGRWLRVSVSAVRDGGGGRFAMVVVDDVSLRKAAARALERSEARLRSYTDHAPLGVIVLDGRGEVLELNPAALALLGRTPMQAWRRSALALLSEHGEPLSRFAWRPLLRAGRCSIEAQLRREDGSTCWVALDVARIDAESTIAFVQDISKRRLEEQRLRQAHALFRNTQEGMVVTDPDGNVVAANPAFCRITGYPESELIGRNMNIVSSGRQDGAFYEALWTALRERGFWQGEIWNRRRDGDVYPEWITINAVRDAEGTLTNFVAACIDITESKRSERELERLAHHDPLTGLPNRLLLMRTLEQALARARRTGAGGAVLMLDLDRFKNVNDSLGHPVGDELLREVACRLKSRLRDGHTIARLGGDEFIVLLENLAQPDHAGIVAQALIEACAVPFELAEGRRVYVGASIGISSFPGDGMQPDRLIQQADAAMYSAKNDGRGTFRYFSREFVRDARTRLEMDSDLRHALERGQFHLHYQPLVRAADGAIEGVEALVRWHDPERGLVPPAAFIPLAEETGLIVPLGDWILRQACLQMKRWQAHGVAPLMIAVNLSPRQFAQANLVEQIARALRDTGLEPRRLELEITEGALMDAAQAGARLRDLKALGVKLAVDDFGTGYSSLAYLSRFPLDKLKVDQSFVRRILEDPTDAEIATAVISLAKNLKLRVLAEGVETQAQYEFLRERGCDLLQGFLFARPMPAGELEAMFALRGVAEDKVAAL